MRDERHLVESEHHLRQLNLLRLVLEVWRQEVFGPVFEHLFAREQRQDVRLRVLCVALGLGLLNGFQEWLTNRPISG